MLSAFSLHSKADAAHVIFLDFDGHVTRGTDMNRYYAGGKDIVSPAYDRDGNASSFSDAELVEIEHIWQRVGEDFAPFNVDVTTEEPDIERLRKTDANDTQWGIRIVVSAYQGWLTPYIGKTVGGVTLVGSFTWNSDTPGFVFNIGEVAAADTISHETGHGLGLSHAGTGKLNADGSLTIFSEYYYGHGSGETGWAPIMGAGFAKNLSQWSQGEYPNAYPAIGTYYRGDQLDVITTLNGFGYRQDAPDTLNYELVHEVSGIIETRTDKDGFYFHILSKSSVTLRGLPAQRGANLDIELTLSDGMKVISVVNPVDRLGADLTMILEAGTYFVTIDGVGKPASGSDYGYSDYGSLGQYTVTLEVAEIGPPLVEVGYGAQVVDLTTVHRIIPWEVKEIRIKGNYSFSSLTVTGRQGVLSPTAYRKDGEWCIWTFEPIWQDRLKLSGAIEGRLDVLFGDINGDGTVNIIDALLQRGFNGTSDPWADINGDGIVNLLDALLLRGHNGQTLD